MVLSSDGGVGRFCDVCSVASLFLLIFFFFGQSSTKCAGTVMLHLKHTGGDGGLGRFAS